ncbi:glycoside hydrolase family 38 C-terminal domain-containing protein [Paenibacillus sp. Marseille-Q4541]|uniref:alpha-mannosidase n=1 Tax=Paenibacillus sp. Marseille-Q4541 TaxID=2831522 RepID=UPI001BA88CAC|nr:glycoside hydrolase family 38 C-terminal domain-containing protein [Paenibacillus sp. Marseille-Q4541]
MPYEPIRPEQLQQMVTKLRESIYQPIAELEVTAWVTSEPVPYEERRSGTEITLTHGERWGELWDCAWFRFTGHIPQSESHKKIVLLLDVNGELCLVDDEGTPIQGLTTINSEFDFSLGLPGKRVVDIREPDVDGGRIELWADAGNNDLFGKYRGGTLHEALIAVCREDIRKLYYDAEVLLETAEQLPAGTARKERIYQTLYEVSLLLRQKTEDCINQAQSLLSKQLSMRGGDPVVNISAVGHAHMDLAWLWPIRETIRKGARTFSTVLQMMDRYPDYVFGASQPQLYDWMKQHYPKLYAKIKQRVREGRWEPQGAMWVESDTNVPGGESLVRQILYGKRYFQQEFGMEVKSLWMPDVFGYSASLPQILKKSGVDYMMTQKLSWSEYNRHPHHSFLWEGIDGSSVLTHMPPEDTYNSPAAPRSIVKAERNYLDKNVSEHCLMLFGIGDGGGGPGEEHLERLAREKNLLGLSPVVQEPSWRFFERLNEERERLQTWRGELYLEKHQGTLTSQARSKRYNRKMEKALRELEFASVLAAGMIRKPYPAETLENIWKEVLLYQFHDILPGSSIKRVYDESLERYEALLQQTETMITETYSELTHRVSSMIEDSEKVVIFNSLPWERKEWIHVNGHWRNVQVPSMGYTVMSQNDNAARAEEVTLAETDWKGLHASSVERTLENDIFTIKFDENGAICSIFDKVETRNVIPQGYEGNALRIYHDGGDAWDFPHDYSADSGMRLTLIDVNMLTDGPRAGLIFDYIYGESKLSQIVVLTEGSRRIDFETVVDWKEDDKMLRTSFPVDVRSDSVHCEIQFGNLSRPTHRNTMWDFAKDEICAHQWIDLSEPDYGVALLNDCKYGHRARNNILDLNLLRSSSYPDPDADRSAHTFTYSLYPHQGDHVQAEIYRRGNELNIPLRLVSLAAPSDQAQNLLPDTISLLQIEHPHVMVESVKKAEDSDDMIIRLYETSGSRIQTTIRTGFDMSEAWIVDLMETIISPLQVNKDTEIALSFTPFEIVTLRVKARV